jgi:hypothetical protein
MLTKEEIKQFLKPDWRKAGLSAIILLIIPLIFFSSKFDSLSEFFLLMKFLYAGLFFPIIIYYLSCLIVFVWNRTRNNKIKS